MAAVHAVLELLPGNAAEVILGESATPESLAAMEAQLGLDRPAHILTPASSSRRVVNMTAIAAVDAHIRAARS